MLVNFLIAASILQKQSGVKVETPARLLTGKELKDGWVVLHRVTKDSTTDTGGHFSCGYIIQSKEGKYAFLKAIDFSRALTAEDPAQMLESIAAAFNFERNILRLSKEKKMSRVATPIGDGIIDIRPGEISSRVQYLIFDLAKDDLRRHLSNATALDDAWKLAALHHICTGMMQLHEAGIAHQDIKPSNVLVFGKNDSRVTDVGRAYSRTHSAPHDFLAIAGDMTYAPPELLYNHVHSDNIIRRFGCDAYLMGSMVAFVFVRQPMTPLLLQYVREEHKPHSWSDEYKDVLPYIRDAFGFAVDWCRQRFPPRFQEQLTQTVTQLCEPDPLLRGDPKTRARVGNPYSLERYVSKFDLMAKQARARDFRDIS